VVACGEQIQPLLGCYQQRSLALLGPAARAAEQPVREAVAAIAPRLLQVEDREVLFNVNAPEDLLQAAAILDRRRRAASRT
jgi:molybdopterin-guanine dinucleotide biosynthesis protein A